jgi:hypothetical protein
MENRGNNILTGLLAFVLVMAIIGWAKFLDAGKEVERIQEDFRSLIDDRNNVQNDLGNCRRLKDQYKSILDVNQFVVDGLREELDLCHSQLADIVNKFYAPEACRPIQCGWDMCACNDSVEGCPIYVLEYYVDQAVCRTDTNCKNCMWQMIDNGGGLDHDEILWCLEHAYYP